MMVRRASARRSQIKKLFHFFTIKNLKKSIFELLCFTGCVFQLFSVISEYLQYNIVVEIEIDLNDYNFIPAITISNDFFMFLNQTKISEEFESWKNLSTLARTRNFLSLKNLTSSFKFSFLYDENVLFENCTVYDIHSLNISQEKIDEYERVSQLFRTEILKKDEFSKINFSLFNFNPPYIQQRKCRDVAEIYLRTEYKDITGWSDHLWYVTLFHRSASEIKDNRFKISKSGHELLLSLKWELVVAEEIDFGFKIHFHSPDQAPNSKQAAILGINGKAHKWITLGYSHSIANFLKKPFKTNCYNYLDHNFESRQDCIDTCKFQLSSSLCRTLPLYTIMELGQTTDFINKKEHATCFNQFKIELYCEQKCSRKDCSTDFYSAFILSEVSQSGKSLIIDIVKPNIGVNRQFNCKQSMKIFEVILYCGSTISLWYGLSVYVCVRESMNYAKKYLKNRKSLSKTGFLRKTKYPWIRSTERSKLSRTSIKKDNLLSYQTLYMINQQLEKERRLDEQIKKKFGSNYNYNIDQICRNLTYYDNHQMNNQSIKFINLDLNDNLFRRK